MVAKLIPTIVIVGPTASGKTSLGIKIAKKYNGEVICADSRTVYKDLHIGTAKPTTEETSGVKHHLLSVVAPDQKFSVADFKRLANRAISDVKARGKVPILVGGSGLYINSVIYDYKFAKKASDELRNELSGLTIDELQDRCFELEIPLPENSKNKRYLIRAIEAGGTPKSRSELSANTLVVGIKTTKDELNARITTRIFAMYDQGVVEETTKLINRYGGDLEVLNSNIYGIVRRYLAGEIELNQTKELAISGDLKLAKKQLTWFKRDSNIVWGNTKELLSVIDDFITSFTHNLPSRTDV